jgi:hypothetical protein
MLPSRVPKSEGPGASNFLGPDKADQIRLLELAETGATDFGLAEVFAAHINLHTHLRES